MKTLMLPLVAAAALASGPASAHDFKAGTLEIKHPWARETAPGQTAGGGFLTVVNRDKVEDQLLAVSSPAGAVQLHSMSMDGGVMRMRAVEGGVTIPAGGMLELKPGGYHLMFVGLGAPFRKGDKVPAELRFRRAGAVKVVFVVKGMTDGAGHRHGHGHGGHSGHEGH